MPIQFHAQRNHLLYSLDTLLYQLFSVSFFLSPSLLSLISRCATQWQFTKTREFDSARGLVFWLAIVLLVNTGSLWTHFFDGAVEGRAVIIDFVGMAHTPSKFQLLLLDFTIIFLQFLLTTITFDTSLSKTASEESSDTLAPQNSRTADEEINRENRTSPSSLSTLTSSSATTLHNRRNNQTQLKAPIISTPTAGSAAITPIIDLRLGHIIRQLTRPTPQPTEHSPLDRAAHLLSLPMPNTTAGRMTRALRVLEELRSHRSVLEQELARRRRERRNGNNANASANREVNRRFNSTLNESISEESTEEGMATSVPPVPMTSIGRIPGAIDDMD